MSTNSIYPATSPYNTTDIVDTKYLDVMNYRPIPRKPSDVYYTIPAVYQYRPDLLAFDLYGDSKLWWVFAERNPNRLGKDPYFDFVAGLGIYIPTQDTLKQVLGI
jgi:alpha-L-fucosidase